ncbi:MAG: hydroxymethylpyrimidine/phosphomethylpyrimidine kinase [Betaproteobacteria bacterium]|nr:hydroxymethylpyrimidine/phosphomethylpyrimidine kinase [Betaproteobacteria bacterium]MCL2885439.1 hydroxymethylpyrimidine/phosphomethylpyrimidine kinase [Betaproteobacteria bacterium]
MNPFSSPPPGPPQVLVFAASDPSSGAGIQADLLTLASLGCHPLTALTAITVQDTIGVERVQPVAAELLDRQARAILADMPVAAFKVGLLGSVDNVLTVARIAAAYPQTPLVLDPVLASGRGDALANDAIIAAIREVLLPRVTLLTPNAPEARRLAGDEDDANELSLAVCAERLIALGARQVLITGAHENTPEVVNTLYGATGVIRRDSWQRLPGSYHGSGCTLASAIAAFLARGETIEEAVRAAQDYTWQTLQHAFRGGRGQWIPNRFFRAHEHAH